MAINPLLYILVEARRNGATIYRAILQVLCVLTGKVPGNGELPYYATGFVIALGEPTWDDLFAWAKRFAADPDRASWMEKIRQSSSLANAQMDDYEQEEWAALTQIVREIEARP